MPDRLSRRAVLAGAAASLALGSRAYGAPSDQGFLPVEGGRIFWVRFGKDRPGTPLLTLHGGPGAAHNYLLSLKALADERPVIFYDQLGCGRSDAPKSDAPYTIPRFVREVDAVRRALGLERMHLFGHSWGSMLAIEYMLTGKHAGVERLVLGGALASVPQFVAGTKVLARKMPGGERLLALNAAGRTTGPEYQKLIDRFYANYVLRVPPNSDVQATFAFIAVSPAYAKMNGPNEIVVVGTLKDWDRRAELGDIRVPTLIVTGTYDEVDIACHRTLQQGIRGSRLVVLPGCSHLAMQEKPALYVRTLRSFLA